MTALRRGVNRARSWGNRRGGLIPSPGPHETWGVDWASVTWEAFERALTEYRDREYLGRSRISGENAYLDLFAELADVPMVERVSHVESVVLFLNRWNCHFPREESPAAIAAWLSREGGTLQSLVGSSILDSEVPERVGDFDRLHDSLIELRRGSPRIFTMSDACASKLLHQMVPALFVMWDSKIRSGFGNYGAFVLDMHRFALLLRDELAPEEARTDIDGYLQRALAYSVRKPLAKYIDEYNWWVAWGLSPTSA